MTDQNTLKEMIEKQERVIKEALEQLKELKSMISPSDVETKKSDVKSMDLENLTSSIRDEIEKRRSEIMNKVEKIKIEAQSKAKQAMSKASSGAAGMPSMGMPSMGMPSAGMPSMVKPSYLPDTENGEDLNEKLKSIIDKTLKKED